MKNFTLSMATIMLMSTSAIAKWYPATGPDSYNATQEQKSNSGTYTAAPYLGIAYSYMNLNVDIPEFIIPISGLEYDIQGDNLSIIGGYDFLSFLAVEGRYSKTIGDLDISVSSDGPSGPNDGITWGGNMTNAGVYFKPKYTSSNVTIYALLGMGHVKLDLDNIGEVSETEFQWGAGISIDGGKGIIGNSNVSFFVDYVRLYDEEAPIIATDDLVIDMFNVGLIYKF